MSTGKSSFPLDNTHVQAAVRALGLNSAAKLMNVVASTLVYTDGRDKSMKVIQYTLSVIMITFFRKYKAFPEYHAAIDGVMKMFGDARKIIRLGNFSSFFSKLVYLVQNKGFNPNTQLSKLENKHYPLLLVKTGSEFLNCITDDIFCLSRFNIMNKDFGDYCKSWSIKLWWTSLSIDLYLHVLKLVQQYGTLSALENAPITQEKADENGNSLTQDDAKVQARTLVSTTQTTLIKILADMVFCGYDLFHIKSNIELMHFAGIVSGYIGYSRLFTKTLAVTKA